MINYNGTMIWNDFRLDDLSYQGDVYGRSNSPFNGYCGGCFGGAVRVERPNADAGESIQGIKMTYTLPYSSSNIHK